MDPVSVATGILLGAFFGGEAALLGYLKSEDLPVSWSAILTKKFWEKFDPIKALKTILLGMIIGGYTQGTIFAGQITDPNYAFLNNPIFLSFVYTTLIMGVDQFMKFIVRRTPLVKAWNYLKSIFGK